MNDSTNPSKTAGIEKASPAPTCKHGSPWYCGFCGPVSGDEA